MAINVIKLQRLLKLPQAILLTHLILDYEEIYEEPRKPERFNGLRLNPFIHINSLSDRKAAAP